MFLRCFELEVLVLCKTEAITTDYKSVWQNFSKKSKIKTFLFFHISIFRYVFLTICESQIEDIGKVFLIPIWEIATFIPVLLPANFRSKFFQDQKLIYKSMNAKRGVWHGGYIIYGIWFTVYKVDTINHHVFT